MLRMVGSSNVQLVKSSERLSLPWTRLSQAGQNSNFSRDLASYVIKIEKEGPRFGWWRPFSDVGPDVVSSCTVSPQTRANEIATPIPA
jgi:hypothetical protein